MPSMTIDINLVKSLRDMTSAPLGDCKEALVASHGDIEQAKERLRKKGMNQAAKKSDRETHEGVTKFVQRGDLMVGVKILCETDFVAKNDIFIAMVQQVIESLFVYGKEADSISQCDSDFIESLQLLITETIAKLGENMKLDDVCVISGGGVAYNHPGDKIAAAVFYEGADHDVQSLAKDVALQVAAMNPQYISLESVPSAEKELFLSTAKQELAMSGKPADMVETIAMGKFMKHYADLVLLEQSSIKDDSKKVRDLIHGRLTITQIKRYAI